MNPLEPRFKILPGMAFETCDLTPEGYVRSIHPSQLHGEVTRMSGEALCPVCSHPALSHPMCDRIKDQDNVPFLHVLCDGRRVKL